MKPNFSIVATLGVVLLAATFTVLPVRADYQSTVLSQGPVAYYRLNETIQPLPVHATNSGTLGTVADGVFTNLALLNQPGPFTGSVSVSLDGVSQYVYTPWSAGLNTSTFSVELWANPAAVPNFAYVASSAEINSPRSGWYLAQDNGDTFGYGPAWVVRLFNTNAANPSVTVHAANSAVGWMHLVFTYDGTTAKLYTNGVVADTELTTTNLAGYGYVPNVDAPFTIGIRSSINLPWPGNAAEVALYSGALSAARVAAHYTAATTTPASYSSTVLADAPLLYDRYKAPPNASITNSGTLGTAYNGILLSDAHAASPGPIPPTYPGFEAANKSVSFDAQGGAARLPAFNLNTNTITISGWVNATNAQLAGAGIVVCDSGTTAGGLIIDRTFGGLGLGYYWNNDPSTFGWSPNQDAGLPLLNSGEWAFVSLVIQPTEADIYIVSPTIPFTGVTNYYTHINQAFDGPTLVGTDAGHPTYSFNGAIDEVAVWNRALTSGELYTEYASAVGGLKPIIFGDPPSPSQPIVAGDTLTLTVNVGGTPILSYQWRSNSVPIPGGTNAVYSKANFNIASDSGNYNVIVTNLYGAATSGVAVVTGQIATAPVIVSRPVGATIYPGGVLSLSVVATGGGLQFQWKTNGTPIPGALNATYTVASVTTNNAGAYSVSVTNSLGATNLGPVQITVPTLTNGTYAAVVDADAPDSWWRLDETSITNGTILADGMGRHSGAYTNKGGLTVSSPGAVAGGIAGTAITFSGDGSYGYIPYFSELSNSKFTLELWARQTTVVNNVTVASSYDSSGNGYGIGAQSFWQGLTGSQVFGQPLGSQASGNPNWNPTITTNQWVHIVIIYNPGSSATYPYQIYVNGATDGYIWGANPLNNSSPFIIGGFGTGNSSILKNAFIGSVDEVAFYNKILNSSQIQAHYAAAFFGVPPSFSVQPQSLDAFVGQNVSFSTATAGGQPITLQWKKNGVNLPGQTNTTLVVSNVFYTASSDIYTVAATNSAGSAISSNAVVTVYYPPTFANLTNGLVLHLKFDGNYSDSSGRSNNGTPVGSPTFVPGKIGSQALTVSTDTTNSTYNYVTLGTPTDFLFGANVDFSVSYWVKFPAGTLPGDLPFFCSAVTSTDGYGITLAPAVKTGGWAWSLDNSTPAGAGVQGPSGTINDGSWHNVVETFSRAGNGTTYLDGVLVNATPIGGIGSIDSGKVFNIGQDPTGTYQESGVFSLDDMGVWRRALTDIEAESIYIVGQNYGKSFDTIGPVTLAISPLASGKLGVAWQTGTLKQANKLTGPWTPVPGATPPFYQFTPTPTNTFYGVGP